MTKTITEKFSFLGWTAWDFIKGRKKLVITLVGLIGANAALDPNLLGLLAGGVVFEGVWAIAEFFFKEKTK